jgi:class 3 adenylate cyclase
MYHAAAPISEGSLTAHSSADAHTLVERAYLVTDVIDSTLACAHCDELGAYLHVRAFLDGACASVRGHAGEVVKLLGDGIEACFSASDQALHCGLEILSGTRRSRTQLFAGTRVALTWGRLIGYRVDGHADYFGRAVILAARMARHGHEACLSMSPEFVGTPAVARVLEGCACEPSSLALKGLGAVAVRRLSLGEGERLLGRLGGDRALITGGARVRHQPASAGSRERD